MHLNKPVFAEHLAVVGGIDHQRVVAHAGLVEGGQHLRHVVVDHGDPGQGGVAGAARHLLRHRLPVEMCVLPEPRHGGVLVFAVIGGQLGQGNVLVAVRFQ